MKAPKHKQTYSLQGNQIHHQRTLDHPTNDPIEHEDKRSENDKSKKHNTNWIPHRNFNFKGEILSISKDKRTVTDDEDQRPIKRNTERGGKGPNNAKDIKGSTPSVQGSEVERSTVVGDSTNYSSI